MKSVLTLDFFKSSFSFLQLKTLINRVLTEIHNDENADLDAGPTVGFMINTLDHDVDRSRLTRSQTEAIFELEDYLQKTFYATTKGGELVGYNVGTLTQAAQDGEFDVEFAGQWGVSMPVNPINPLAVSFTYRRYRLTHFFGQAPGFLLGSR